VNGNGIMNSVSKSKTVVSYNSMEESIIMQPQFQQMEINGKHEQIFKRNLSSVSEGKNRVETHCSQPSQRRRRNSSNSKDDYSPHKTNNGRYVQFISANSNM
jgi:myotubularin-related protein 3/4